MTMHEVKLDYPVEIAGKTYATLSLRRPKARDIEQMGDGKGNAVKRTYQMIADLAQVSIDVIRELDSADMEKINDWLMPIIDPKGLRFREASS